MKIYGCGKWPAGYQQNTGPFNFRMLLQVAWLSGMVVSLTACCFAREIYIGKEGVAEQRSRLDGRDVVVGYFKDIRVVKQDAPDLCWAASLELALAHQGVDTDQTRIAQRVYNKSEAGADRTLNMFWWRTRLHTWYGRLHDGSEIWIINDVDGGGDGVILSSFTFGKRIIYELSRNRIPLVGISTGPATGHVVAVVGLALPGTELPIHKRSNDEVVGFVIYDPLTTSLELLSTERLFEKSTGELVYVTTYESYIGFIFGQNCSAKNQLLR